MQNYCFNYTVDGVMSVLPSYICAKGASKTEAHSIATAFLQKENGSHQVKIYDKNYPNMAGASFQSQSVPDYFYGQYRAMQPAKREVSTSFLTKIIAQHDGRTVFPPLMAGTGAGLLIGSIALKSGKMAIIGAGLVTIATILRYKGI